MSEDTRTRASQREEPRSGLEIVVMTDAGPRRVDLPRAGSVTIGRGDAADVVIDDTSISRAHAALHIGAALELEDLGSSNGTFIGGVRLDARRRVQLAPGEFFEVGSVICVVRGATAPDAADDDAPGDLVVASPAMVELHDLVERVAAGGINVLLLGETGVGKEVFAAKVHARSPRVAGPFVKLNCAAFTDSLVESELFGHEKGAFTGADRRKIGLLEAGSGGVVFLDEVGELALSIQAKLLRVIEDGKLRRVGGLDDIAIDVVFVSATNRDLAAEVTAGRFRADLYYRLNGFTITIPPLRERREEIAPLARAFAAAAARRMSLPAAPALPDDVVDLLQRQRWSGNIRELRNAMDRAVLLARGGAIRPEHLPVEPPRAAAPGSLEGSLARASAGEAPADLTDAERAERARIIEALAEAVGNQTRAAEVLGISRRWLTTLMERYAIPRPRKR